MLSEHFGNIVKDLSSAVNNAVIIHMEAYLGIFSKLYDTLFKYLECMEMLFLN